MSLRITARLGPAEEKKGKRENKKRGRIREERKERGKESEE